MKFYKIGVDALVCEDIEKYVLSNEKNKDRFAAYYDDHPACDQLNTLFHYEEVIFPKHLKYLQFDKTLVRGMHYYTGMIFEVVLRDGDSYGSIAAGGRYDNLIGEMRGGKNNQVPVVGVSFGIDRILTILNLDKQIVKNNPLTELFITFVKTKTTSKATEAELFDNVLLIANSCREYDFRVSIVNDPDMPLKAQIKLAGDKGNAFILMIGETELANETVRVRELQLQLGNKKAHQEQVLMSELFAYLEELQEPKRR